MSKKGKYNNPLQATLKGITDLYGKRTEKVQLPDQLDLSRRRIMITGASSGLGYATALKIAKAGAEVIMPMRSGIPDKGDSIRKISGNSRIRMYPVDLSDFASIDNLVQALIADGIRVDTFISNAAMVPLKSRKTPQGLEEMFMVNYLSAFYLTNRLLTEEIIEKGPSGYGRIIITSSESHRNADTFDWEEFGVFKEYGIGETVNRYGYFKLLLTTFAQELSRQLADANIPVYVRALCPGPVNSNIAREAPGWMHPLLKFTFSLFFRSPEKACAPLLYYVSEDLRAASERIRYLFLLQPRDMDELARDRMNGSKLWQMSRDLVERLGYPIS